MTQPEALRLADLLEPCCLTIGDAQQAVAAAELRRLHAELERCKQVCAATSESWRTDAEKWKGQRDALLEALEDFGMKHYENTGEVLHRDVYESLKSALVEDAMQKFTDVSQEIEAALAEPVQEPVAWMHTDPDNTFVCFLEWRENEPGYRGRWIKTPLYTAPPQRKPLTEEEIDALALVNSYLAFARAVEQAHGII